MAAVRPSTPPVRAEPFDSAQDRLRKDTAESKYERLSHHEAQGERAFMESVLVTRAGGAGAEGQTDCGDEVVAGERLGEERRGTGGPRLTPRLVLVVGGDENDGHVAS